MVRYLFLFWNLLMVPVGAYALVSLGYGVLAERLDPLAGNSVKAPVAAQVSGGEAQRAQRPDAGQYAVIYERTLFGTLAAPKAEEKAPAIDLDALQRTTLRLKLWGTIASENVHEAFAVIEDTAKKTQDLYRVGDRIQDATVRMILRQKVVLTRRGQDEILEMDPEEGQKTLASAARLPAGAASLQEISRQTIDESLQDINELMRQIRIRPNFEDGKPAGLRVDRLRSDSIFRQLGLENGDVIKGVNGKEIQSVDDALTFYDQLKNASSVSLQVERRGAPQTLSYTIRN